MEVYAQIHLHPHKPIEPPPLAPLACFLRPVPLPPYHIRSHLPPQQQIHRIKGSRVQIRRTVAIEVRELEFARCDEGLKMAVSGAEDVGVLWIKSQPFRLSGDGSVAPAVVERCTGWNDSGDDRMTYET